jgi:hypothetical protein
MIYLLVESKRKRLQVYVGKAEYSSVEAVAAMDARRGGHRLYERLKFTETV